MATVNPMQSKDMFMVDSFNDMFKLIAPDYSEFVGILMAKQTGADIVTGTATTYEWFDTTTRPMSTGLNGALDATQTDVVYLNGDFGVVDQLILIDDEVMLVTAYNETTNTATVTRAFQGTTGAIHADGVEIVSLGYNLAEDDEAIKMKSTVSKLYNNYQCIYMETYDITKTAQAVGGKGNGGMNQRNVEQMKAMKQLIAGIENGFVRGIRRKDVIGNKEYRRNDGIIPLIEANGIVVDETGNDLTFEIIDATAKAIYEAGGAADLLAGNYYIMAPINQITRINSLNQNIVSGSDNLSRVSREDKDSVVGRKVLVVQTTVGPINVMPISSFTKTKTAIVKIENCGMKTLRPFEEQENGKKGLTEEFQIDGEVTLELMELPLQAIITGLNE